MRITTISKNTANHILRYFIAFLFFTIASTISLFGQEKQNTGSLTIYGFTMLDAGYNFNQIDPDWYDVVRPTKLPSYKNEFGTDGNLYFSVRQTRFGVEGIYPTKFGDMKVIFEFELFGVGADAGKTTFRLRHAYGELGQFGAGQYFSPFMDIDIFPNSIEYWGPNGMVFLRNLQIRWMPIKGESHLTFALEMPGASADEGIYAQRIELEDVKPHFPLPDFSTEYRFASKWGYVELAGLLRYIGWEDIKKDSMDLSGNAIGWGLNLSSKLNFTKSTTGKFQVVYGNGIQNYMDDAPADIGIKNNFSDPNKPIIGVPLPILGIVAFIDQQWSEKFSSSIGYSSVHINNSDGQSADAFRQGHYALLNLLYYPVANMMAGIELQYGNRQNYQDGWNTSLLKIQFSFKYKFSETLYRKNKN